MAKPELGTKRLCASCGAKFYDLSKDPIVCPKCGTIYEVAAPVAPRGGRSEAARMTTESELPETTEAEFVSLEEADAEASGGKKVTAGEDIADVDEDVDLDESLDDDAFIAEDEEEDTDVSEILGGDIEDEEET